MSKALLSACYILVVVGPGLRGAPPPDARAPLQYAAIPVPVPQSTYYHRGSRVVDLNTRGDVLAVDCYPNVYFDMGDCTAVLWSTKTGVYQTLFYTCPLGSCATSSGDVMLRLNEHGEVGGRTRSEVVLWSESRGLRVLGLVQPYNQLSRPIVGFNDRGEIAGVTLIVDPWRRAGFIASEQTGITYLEGAYHSIPAAMNAAGEIVGYANFKFNETPRAFYWNSRRGMIDVGSLFGKENPSSASSIDKHGSVLGSVEDYSANASYMFLWQEQRGLMAKVPLPPSALRSASQ